MVSPRTPYNSIICAVRAIRREGIPTQQVKHPAGTLRTGKASSVLKHVLSFSYSADGDDGLWSSFALRVGTPEQVVRVLISTAGQATWVVIPFGCQGSTVSNCDQSRGGLFHYTESESWNSTGNYFLGLELNLDYNVSGLYGHDKVALGFSGAAPLESQVIAGIADEYYYVGMFGLGQQPTNLSTYDNSQPSFLATLKTRNMIPSLSWSYTAGAHYQLKGVFGSLTFGGYDLSRFVPNNVPFFLAPDISRDLVVGLQSISLTSSAGSTVPLLPSPIFTFIDSTIPWIYLPLKACQEFEKELGLAWDNLTRLYLISDDLHNNLTANGYNFTFQIGDLLSGGPTVDIVLPYAAFNLMANPPFVKRTMRYFPLQQAKGESQYTLGRTFLQEAYLITNYEHSNFSVSQCKYIDGLENDIIAIPPSISTNPPSISTNPPANSTNPPSISTNPPAISTSPPAILKSPPAAPQVNKSRIIGIALGIAGFLTLGVLLLVFLRKKRRSAQVERRKGAAATPSRPPEEIEPPEISQVQEIDNNSLFFGYREMDDSGIAELRAERSTSVSVQEVTQLPRSDQSMTGEPMARLDMDGASTFISPNRNKSSAQTTGTGPAPPANPELTKPTDLTDY
ncbi:MAG: hypothetical protein Q9187_002296 [Circinaria calcarea]